MVTNPTREKYISADSTEIARALRLMVEPGQVVELRALEATTPQNRRSHIISGYFNDMDALVSAAASINAKGVCVTLNPVNPALLARAVNRVRDVGDKEPLTSDSDIVKRNHLALDFDPVRPAGISSSREEHEAALTRARAVRDALVADGWPTPILADSGNGAHLVFRVDLPTKDDGLVKRAIEAVAFRFSDAQVSIDLTVFNPARIWKLYGTVARKGDDTPERPHRLSRILEAPTHLEEVPKALIERLAATALTVTALPPPSRTSVGNFDLASWIAEHALDVIGPMPWPGGQKWIFKVCPWNEEHRNRSAFIVQLANGAIGAGCHHNGCAGKGWADLRDLYEPGRPKRPATFSANGKNAESLPPAVEYNIPVRPWPDPLAQEAFHGIAGEFVRLVEPQTEADPAALLIQFLTMVGSIFGRTPHYMVESDRHGCNLFCVLVGETAKGRKGISQGRVQAVGDLVDTQWATERVTTGLSSGEGLISEVRDPVVRDGEVIDSGVPDKRLLVVETEFASVLKMQARQGNTLSPVIRQAWDGRLLRTMVKTNPAKATRSHVSIIGHITRSELQRNLTETEAANGFANRFFWVCVRRSKELPDGGEEVDFTALAERLRKAVEVAKTVDRMRRDTEAAAIWRGVYGKLSEPRMGLFGSMTSRAEAQVLRLSMLYALLDSSDLITPAHLNAGLAVWQYAEDSARYLWGDALGDETADALLRALRASPGGMTRTEIRDLFDRHKKEGEIVRALTVLQEQGFAKAMVEAPAMDGKGGRPTERWLLHG